jgi:Holliday junction resolvase
MKNWNHKRLRVCRKTFVINMDDEKIEKIHRFAVDIQSLFCLPLKNNEVATLFFFCVMYKNTQKDFEVKCFWMVQLVIRKK